LSKTFPFGLDRPENKSRGVGCLIATTNTLGGFNPELYKSAGVAYLPKVEDLDLQLVFSKGALQAARNLGSED
jgi:hypothetical protein